MFLFRQFTMCMCGNILAFDAAELLLLCVVAVVAVSVVACISCDIVVARFPSGSRHMASIKVIYLG